jgi:hypothetical protein
MERFVRNMQGVNMELNDPYVQRVPSSKTHSQTFGKRARSVDGNNGDAPNLETDVGGPLARKRQKSGEDMAEDANEEDTAKEDMAGIAREDNNPRIRGTWD